MLRSAPRRRPTPSTGRPRAAATLTAFTTLAAAMTAGAVTADPAHAAPSTPTTSPAATKLPTQAPVATHDTRLAVPATRTAITVNGVAEVQFAHLTTSARFDVVGLTWSRLTGSPTLQVRALTASGWSTWTDAGADGAGNGAGGSDAIYTGAATAIEVRGFGAAGASASHLKVSLIQSGSTTSDTTVSTAAMAAGSRINATQQSVSTYTYATMPTIISRAAWGADESRLSYNGTGCVTPTYDQTIKAAVVHHTDGSNTYTAAQSASIVRGIYAFHVKDRGWCDIGYNFLVDKYGQIFEGRHGAMDMPVHGAHATYWNTNTVGVSLMMNSDYVAPTSAMRTSLERVLAWKLAGNYVDPQAKVYLVNGTYNTILRHGDVMSTSCPGKNVTALMPTIRSEVAARMGNWKTPIYQAWQAQGGASGTLGAPHVMEEAYQGGRVTVFANGAILQLPNSTATRTMDTATWTRYSALGGPATLGWPTGNQVSGLTSPISTTKSLPLTGGAIIEGTAGAWLTTPAIKAAWWNNVARQTLLGSPVANVVTTTTGSTTTSSQLFQHGRISIVNGAVKVVVNGLWGDVNADGMADVATVANGRVTFRLTAAGVAGGTLAGPSVDATTNWIAQVPDVNGDGFGELVTRRNDGTLWVQLGTGYGTYGTARQIGTGWQTLRELTVAPDMDGDKQPELLAIDSTGQLVRYGFLTSGSLGTRAILATGWTTVQHIASAGDVDGDGKVDVLSINAASQLYLYPGNGTGGIAATGRFLARGWSGFARVWSPGDLSGDGHPDLLALGADGTLRTYTARTTGVGFTRSTNYLSSTTGITLLG